MESEKQQQTGSLLSRIVLIGAISSIAFYIGNFFTSCHQYSFPYLLYTYKHADKLDQLIYYGLKSDIYDPQTNSKHNKPQLRLRDICVTSSQSFFNSTNQIKEYIYKRYIFNKMYFKSTYLMNKCSECLLKHWINSSSDLNLLNDDQYYNFNEFVTNINKLSQYILLNCRFDKSILNKTEATIRPNFIPKNRFKTMNSSSNRILIVGASCAGLVSALSIYRSSLFGTSSYGIDMVTVIDKRNTYSRNQWFDLIGHPFYNTIDTLFNQFGFGTQFINYVNETNDNLTTILLPASVLERFLAKTAYMIGFNVKYNHQYIGYCKEFQNIAIILNIQLINEIKPQIWDCGDDINNLNINGIDSEFYNFERFSIIIGADGTHSAVRSLYDMGWYQQDIIDITRFWYSENDNQRYNINERIPLQINGLRQISLLVNYRTVRYSDSNVFNENDPYGSHNCPQLIYGTDGRLLDPWTASFYVYGVHTVFKRFYYNDCQMQILLNHEVGEYLYKHNQNQNHNNDLNHLIWEIVFNTTQHYLIHPPLTILELKDKYLLSLSLLDNDDDNNNNQEIILLEHAMFLPQRSIRMIDLSNLRRNGIESDSSFGIVLLMGDASMKAHYRLGVGINRIYDGYQSYISFYNNIKKTILNKIKLIDFIIDFTKDIEYKLQWFVEFQASTIFMECYCDFIVFFDRKDDLNEAQVLVKRDVQYHDYVEMESVKEQQKLIQKCIDKYVN